jgi:hypothetical protein
MNYQTIKTKKMVKKTKYFVTNVANFFLYDIAKCYTYDEISRTRSDRIIEAGG